MVEVFPGKYTTPVFQPVAVHGPALNSVVLNDGIGPLAELDRPVIVMEDLEAFNKKAFSEDGVSGVFSYVPLKELYLLKAN